jgi:hypothetical protein
VNPDLDSEYFVDASVAGRAACIGVLLRLGLGPDWAAGPDR